MEWNLSDQALNPVGTDDQVSVDDLTRRECDAWPAFSGVNMLDCGAESDHDVVGIGYEVEEEAMELGTVNMVVRRIIVDLHAVQLGVANYFAGIVWTGSEDERDGRQMEGASHRRMTEASGLTALRSRAGPSPHRMRDLLTLGVIWMPAPTSRRACALSRMVT